jgi:DNA invertase Pin-like site-specific DNA recombinase
MLLLVVVNLVGGKLLAEPPYLSVSRLDQNTDNQERELREVAGRAGYDVTKVYRDHGVSGAKGRDKRPQFDAPCRNASRRKFDVIMSWSVDRLGRSLTDLLDFLKEIHGLRIDLYLHQQSADTTTPSGKAMFQMMGVFAEFERGMIRERAGTRWLGASQGVAGSSAGSAPRRRRHGDQDSRTAPAGGTESCGSERPSAAGLASSCGLEPT